MIELFANSGDPDQMPHSVVSDLGLYCLPITLLGVFRLQWVKLNLLLYRILGGGRVVRRCCVSYITGASN